MGPFKVDLCNLHVLILKELLPSGNTLRFASFSLHVVAWGKELSSSLKAPSEMQISGWGQSSTGLR